MLHRPLQARPHNPGQKFSAFSSPHRKIVSRGDPLATAKQAIPKSARCHHCVAVSHIFDVMASPAQLLSWQCATRTSGSPYTELRSWQPSAPWSAKQARPLASHCNMSVRYPSEWGGQWHFSRHASTRT